LEKISVVCVVRPHAQGQQMTTTKAYVKPTPYVTVEDFGENTISKLL
jgi:hypothetical protein